MHLLEGFRRIREADVTDAAFNFGVHLLDETGTSRGNAPVKLAGHEGAPMLNQANLRDRLDIGWGEVGSCKSAIMDIYK